MLSLSLASAKEPYSNDLWIQQNHLPFLLVLPFLSSWGELNTKILQTWRRHPFWPLVLQNFSRRQKHAFFYPAPNRTYSLISSQPLMPCNFLIKYSNMKVLLSLFGLLSKELFCLFLVRQKLVSHHCSWCVPPSTLMNFITLKTPGSSDISSPELLPASWWQS